MTRVVVCLESGAKALPRRSIQRLYRLRKQHKERPFREFHVQCRECNLPIKPSYERPFCPGGKCKRAFFNRVQVRRVESIDFTAHSLSQAVLHV